MNMTSIDLLFAVIGVCIAIIISVAMFSLEAKIGILIGEIRRLWNEK